MENNNKMPELLSLPECAERLGISLRSMYNYDVPVVKIGKRSLVRTDSLTQWLDSLPSRGGVK